MNTAVKSLVRRVAIAVAGIVAIASALVAAWMLFLVVVFQDNFNFQKPTHLGIFIETCVFIVIAIFANLALMFSRSRRSYLLVVVTVCLAALTFWLWSIPAARGLIH